MTEPMPRGPWALLSVSDKRGITELATALVQAGFHLLSTGGTLRTLRDAGLSAHAVSALTQSPEILDGRVKTLHPRLHGGLLYRRDLDDHQVQAREHQLPDIQVVVVNLYPFEATIAREGVSFAEAVEQIDIGGPAMVRASAKNHASVAVVTSPDDYAALAEALVRPEGIDAALRRTLAAKAFAHTAAYDATIAAWMAQQAGEAPGVDQAQRTPTLRLVASLRYGENPHQAAALYREASQAPLAGAEVLQGKELSYNNLLDLDAAVGAVLEHDLPSAVVVKHTNPCGVGTDSERLATAWGRAHEADPVSAFGGIVAFNRSLDGETARALAPLFLEVVAAPGFSQEARDALARKANLRLIAFDPGQLSTSELARQTLFGTLVQSADPRVTAGECTGTCVTERAPTEEEQRALAFLWRVVKHVRSNAIVIGSAERTYGVGAGQMSRLDAVRLAVEKATGDLQGAALASDAFFPFADGLELAAAAGVGAVIQPGGSKRDAEVIEAANRLGIAMVFTGTRHFRH